MVKSPSCSCGTEIKISSHLWHLYTPNPPATTTKGRGKDTRSRRAGTPGRQGNPAVVAKFRFCSGWLGGFLICFRGDLSCASAGKMAPAKSMERASSFAMACSLLSRYVRENGAAAGELGLGIRAEAADAQKTSADAEKGEARKATMDLFPQNAGLSTEAAPDAREKEKRQLTIFYAGKVLVFDDFPAEKAKDLMQMAGKGASVALDSGMLPAPTVAAVTNSTTVAAVAAAPIPVVSAQKNAADIPQAPKASLRRFLEKRKDRLTAKAPYQGSSSDATPVKKEMPESQPWLGLGPQTANPNLSLRQEGNQ